MRNILEAQQTKLGDQPHAAEWGGDMIKCEAKIQAQAVVWIVASLIEIGKKGKEAGLGLIKNFGFRCVKI